MACQSINHVVQLTTNEAIPRKLHTWEINDRVFTLFLYKNQVCCLDSKTKTTQVYAVKESIEKTVSLLKSMEPYINGDGICFRSRTFCKGNFRIVKEGDNFFWVKDYSRPAWIKDTRYWSEDPNPDRTKYPLAECTIPSRDCHPLTTTIVKRITDNLHDESTLSFLFNEFVVCFTGEVESEIKSLREKIRQEKEKLRNRKKSFLDAISLDPFENVEDAFTPNPIIERLKERIRRLKTLTCSRYFEMEPFSQRSRIDDRLYISKFTWSVTLAAGPTGEKGCHASILIEGLSDGWFKSLPRYMPHMTEEELQKLNSRDRKAFDKKQGKAKNLYAHFDALKDKEYFLHRLHLGGDNNILYENEIEKKDEIEKEGKAYRQYDSRSHIYMVPSEKVKSVIAVFFHQLWGKATIPFSRLGANSMFNSSKAHNCFTWARELLLQMDVKIGQSVCDNVIGLVKTQTFTDKYYKNLEVFPQV